jgi:hypothetical protein
MPVKNCYCQDDEVVKKRGESVNIYNGKSWKNQKQLHTP